MNVPAPQHRSAPPRLFVACAAAITISAAPPGEHRPDVRAEAPVQTVATYTGTVREDSYAKYWFSRMAGRRYVICADVSYGDVDLYGDDKTFPSTRSFQLRSTNSGMATECIGFVSRALGAYYLSVYGNAPDKSGFVLRILDMGASDNP